MVCIMNDENKKTILLVEDEAVLALTGKMLLEQYGYNILTADSGEKAVESVNKTPGIDLILMDINLGSGIDGTQAAEIILKSRDIPLVFLSSHTEPEVVDKTEKITSYGYVVKNSGITVLDASIKMAFKLYNAHTKLQNKMDELQRFLKITVGRELSMVELKKEVNDLLKKSGQAEKYKVVE